MFDANVLKFSATHTGSFARPDNFPVKSIVS
jgi:hypothetical protein